MAVGTVVSFDEQKGFGYIQPDEGGAKVFLHITEVKRAGIDSVSVGLKISYEVVYGANGKASASGLGWA